jgi:uncharacterized membrane protein YhhN
VILLLGALALGLLLGAERWQWPRLRAAAKATASLCFVAVALAQGALQSAFGLALLAGLGLSLVGDLLLLGERTRLFLAGLGAFALAHAAYAIAFGLGGLHGPMLALAGLGMATAAALTLRWLRPHGGAAMRGPVLVYVLIIALMVALALAHALHSGRWPVAAGALLFAASDLAVARERFVQRGFVNKAWGLPAYYAAQLLLAGQAGGAAA